jgi:hypothetical protein
MTRKFKHKVLPMLIAALTVADNLELEKDVFVEENPQWDDPFIDNFRNAAKQILQKYYGISTKEELQEQTTIVNGLTESAKTDLGMVKIQIERGFRTNPERRKWILVKLGYKEYWAKASHSNQTMLIGLLLAFRNNLNDALRTELEQAQVNIARLNNILLFGDTLNEANITQESLKGSSQLNTEKAISALNDIYAQAMDICAIGKKLFVKDKLKRSLFVFGKLVKMQGHSSPETAKEEETPSTETVNQ